MDKIMEKMTNDNKISFCVVDFLELPSEDMDDYVCVPYFWIIFRRLTDQNALVAYPNDVDASEARNLAKRRKKVNAYWNVYEAIIKYESNSYKDAEYWIATRNKFGALKRKKEEESNLKHTQPEPVSDRKFNSSSKCSWSSTNTNKPQVAVKPYRNPRKPIAKFSCKRSMQPELKKKLNKEQWKLDKASKSTYIIEKPQSMVPKCSEENRLIIIQDDQLIQSARTEETPAHFNGKNKEQYRQLNQITENKSASQSILSTSNQCTSSKSVGKKQPLLINQNHKQGLSIPITDVVEPTEVTNINQEIQQVRTDTETPQNTSKQSCQSEFVFKKPTPMVHNYRLQELLPKEMLVRQSTENFMMNTTNTLPNSLKSTNQSFQQHQHAELPYFKAIRSLQLDSQPEKIDIERLTEVIRHDQRPYCQDLINNIRSIDHNVPISVRVQVNKKLQRKPSMSVEKPNVKEICVRKEKRNTSTSAVHSSTLNSHFNSLRPSVIRQIPPVMQNQFQEVSKESVIYAEKNGAISRFCLQGISNGSQEIQRESKINIRRSNEANHINHRTFYKDIACNTADEMNRIDHRTLYIDNTSNTSAAQCLPHLVNQSDFLERSHERQYSPTRDFSQRFAHVNSSLGISNNLQMYDQRPCDAILNGTYTAQNQLNPVIQPSHIHPQYGNRYLALNYVDLQQKRLWQEQRRKFTKFTHTNNILTPQSVRINEPYALQNSSNVLNQLHNPKCFVRGKNLLEDPSVETKLNEKSTKHMDQAANTDRAAFSQNILVKSMPVTQNFNQPTPSERSHKIQFTPICENLIYHHPYKQKLVVNRSTETDFITETINFEYKPGRSSVVENFPKVIDRGCQVESLEE